MFLDGLDDKKKKKLFAFVITFIVMGVSAYFLINMYAGTGTGVAYNWKTGNIESEYQKVNTMPEGWDFVQYTSTLENSKLEKVGLWVPISDPMIGSRDLQIEDGGEDVSALQITLNLVRSEDEVDPFYFDKVIVSGLYDQATTDAVYVLQEFFEQEQTGVADLNFQSSLYGFITVQ